MRPGIPAHGKLQHGRPGQDSTLLLATLLLPREGFQSSSQQEPAPLVHPRSAFRLPSKCQLERSWHKASICSQKGFGGIDLFGVLWKPCSGGFPHLLSSCSPAHRTAGHIGPGWRLLWMLEATEGICAGTARHQPYCCDLQLQKHEMLSNLEKKQQQQNRNNSCDCTASLSSVLIRAGPGAQPVGQLCPPSPAGGIGDRNTLLGHLPVLLWPGMALLGKLESRDNARPAVQLMALPSWRL